MAGWGPRVNLTLTRGRVENIVGDLTDQEWDEFVEEFAGRIDVRVDNLVESIVRDIRNPRR